MNTRFHKVSQVGRTLLSKGGVIMCVFSKRIGHPAAPVGAYAVVPDPAATLLDKWCHLGCTDILTRGFHTHMFEAVDGTRMTSEANPDDITLMRLWDFANAWSLN